MKIRFGVCAYWYVATEVRRFVVIFSLCYFRAACPVAGLCETLVVAFFLYFPAFFGVFVYVASPRLLPAVIFALLGVIRTYIRLTMQPPTPSFDSSRRPSLDLLCLYACRSLVCLLSFFLCHAGG